MGPMAYKFLAVERDQLYLLPPSVADWLPEDHLAWLVLDVVDQMELGAFYEKYRADGCGAPAHTTIARFRKDHEEALKTVFTFSLRLCAQAGMAKVGLVALDGTKMGCPVALSANRTKAHLAERALKEQETGRKLRGRKPKPPAPPEDLKANTSDPESRIMKTEDGYLQGYNAQAVVNDDQVVVAAEVTDEHNDSSQLHPMIETTSRTFEEAGIDDRPGTLLADAGYCSEENLAAFGEGDPDPYIATRNQKKNPTPRSGRRGPLRAGATLVERMDRKVSTAAGPAL